MKMREVEFEIADQTPVLTGSGRLIASETAVLLKNTVEGIVPVALEEFAQPQGGRMGRARARSAGMPVIFHATIADGDKVVKLSRVSGKEKAMVVSGGKSSPAWESIGEASVLLTGNPEALGRFLP